MLYQTDLYTETVDSSALQSNLAVKIHGAAMRLIPTAYAAKLHTQEYHPFSVFAIPSGAGYMIRLSALCDEARVIPEALASCRYITIYGLRQPLQIARVSTAPPLSVPEISNHLNSSGCRIQFVTPAMVKTGGVSSARPELCAFFYSTLLKYNRFTPDCLSYEAFQTAFSHVRFGEYQLSSTDYNVSGHRLPGMVGFCELLFPKATEENLLLRKIIAYASYSGIGGKTGQGMGGIVLTVSAQ